MGPLPHMSVGNHTLTLAAREAGNSDVSGSDQMILAIFEVDAGDNIQISSVGKAATIIIGTVTHPDGATFEYRWLEGETTLLDWTPVGADDQAPLDLGLLSYMAVGNHTLTLQGRETGNDDVVGSDPMILTIENSPPEAQPQPASQTVEVGVDLIFVDANVKDFDGDTLSYQWLKGESLLSTGSAATIYGGTPVAIPGVVLPAGDPRFPVGVHVVSLVLEDGVNAPVSAAVLVDVTDTGAPTIMPRSSTTILWPPNHKLQTVTIQANVFDNGGGPTELSVTVESSEPPDTDGDGNTIPDFYVDSVDSDTGIIELRLRAERAGKGDGRTYTVTITASDDYGNQSTAQVKILAPHDQRKK